MEGRPIEQRREEAVSTRLSRWRRNQRWERKARSDSDRRMEEREREGGEKRWRCLGGSRNRGRTEGGGEELEVVVEMGEEERGGERRKRRMREVTFSEK